MHKSLEYTITRQQLKELSKPNNLKASFDLVLRVFISLSLLVGFISLLDKSFWLSFLCWYLYCIQIHFWGYAGIGHELFHNKVFSSRKWNKFFFYLCSAITWNNSRIFELSHNYHHANTFAPNDKESLSETSWKRLNVFAYIIIDFGLLFRRIKYSVLNSLGRYPNLKKINDKKIIFSAQRIIMINTLVVSSTFFISENVFAAVAVGIAPFCATLLNKVLAKSQHHGLSSNSNGGPLAHSRTIELPVFLSFFYANMNYHIEHHLAPTVPYYNLPKLHSVLVSTNKVTPSNLTDFVTNWMQGKYRA